MGFLFKKKATGLTEKEQLAYIKFIIEHYGPIDQIIDFGNDESFKILVIEPKEDHPYYTLFTMGFQKLKVITYDQLSGLEFMINLPKDWNFSTQGNHKDGWIINVFQCLADKMKSPIGIIAGSTFTFGVIHEKSEHSAIYVDHNYFVPPEDATFSPSKKENVAIFKLYTIYFEEVKAIIEGNEEIKQKIIKQNINDLDRPSFC